MMTASARRPLLLLALLLCAAAPGRAFRPFTTEDAGITDTRKLDLELGWDWSHRQDRVRENVILTSLVYGLVPRLEVGLDLPWVVLDPHEAAALGGLGDAAVNAKFLARRETARAPALAARAAWKTSSGSQSRGLGSGDDDFLFTAVASKNWGGTSAHAMLGRAVAGRRAVATLKDNTFYGAGVDLALNEALSVLAEVFGSEPVDSAASGSPAALRLGGIYTWSKTFWIDASMRLRLSGPAHYWGSSLGLTATFF